MSSTLVRCAQDFAAAGYAEPVRWLEALFGAPEIDVGAMMEIANALPHETLTLRELAASLTERIVQTLRGGATAQMAAGSDLELQSFYAGWLNKLGNRLSDLGRREDALAAAQEAVDIRRRLAADRPDAFLPDLAGSLNNLGARLSDLGRREEALAAAQEAVDIRRRLAASRPDAFLPDLASSLKRSRPSGTGDLGRREDALATRRKRPPTSIAASRPDAFRPDLAGSLNNLGAFLSGLGRREDALAAAQEATDIYRRLADARPNAFLPDGALSLNNLSIRLGAISAGARRPSVPRKRRSKLCGSIFFLDCQPPSAEWMRKMGRQYLQAAESLGVEPDAALLGPIVEALQRLQASPAGEDLKDALEPNDTRKRSWTPSLSLQPPFRSSPPIFSDFAKDTAKDATESAGKSVWAWIRGKLDEPRRRGGRRRRRKRAG